MIGETLPSLFFGKPPVEKDLELLVSQTLAGRECAELLNERKILRWIQKELEGPVHRDDLRDAVVKIIADYDRQIEKVKKQ